MSKFLFFYAPARNVRATVKSRFEDPGSPSLLNLSQPGLRLPDSLKLPAAVASNAGRE